jgi:hypothetical protein
MVVDSVMYFSAPNGVYAVDAVTGTQIWRYTPVPVTTTPAAAVRRRPHPSRRRPLREIWPPPVADLAIRPPRAVGAAVADAGRGPWPMPHGTARSRLLAALRMRRRRPVDLSRSRGN